MQTQMLIGSSFEAGTETEEPILEAADAWARIEATRIETGESGDTEWIDWELRPVESAVERDAPITRRRRRTRPRRPGRG